MSGFVSDRKTEKLTSGFARLMSSLNSDKPQRADLLSQLLYPEKATASNGARERRASKIPVFNNAITATAAGTIVSGADVSSADVALAVWGKDEGKSYPPLLGFIHHISHHTHQEKEDEVCLVIGDGAEG